MFKTVYDTKFTEGNISRINSAYINSKQSPKILSGKLRPLFQEKSLIQENKEMKLPFSLIDAPIGKLARGTKMPKQYDPKEMDRIYGKFNQTATAGFYKKELNEPTKNTLADTPNEINNNDLKDLKLAEHKTECFLEKNEEEIGTDKIEDVKRQKTSSDKNINQITNNSDVIIYPYERNVKTAMVGKRENFANTFTNFNVNSEDLLHNSRNKKNIDSFDKWMPKNLKEHERQIKTANSRSENINTHTLVKEIKRKMLQSDIFFSNQAGEPNRKQIKHNDYQTSDIFMKKNDKVNLNKNGEVYLQKNKVSLFNSSSRSNSEWHPKNSYPTLLNHCSTDYHILNPGVKHISKTKKDLDNSRNGCNPVFRQKSLCEFIDLTRVGVPNPNKEYLNALKKCPRGFGRDSNLCSSYYDIHSKYQGLCEKPFVKKFII